MQRARFILAIVLRLALALVLFFLCGPFSFPIIGCFVRWPQVYRDMDAIIIDAN